MTYEDAKARAMTLAVLCDTAAAVLRDVPGVGSGPMGLTPGAVKETARYRVAKLRYDQAFAELRRFNAWYVKAFKREIAADRAARMANGTYGRRAA